MKKFSALWAQQVPSKLGEEKVLLQVKEVHACYGYIVLCLYRGEFVTWFRDETGDDRSGRYFITLEEAMEDFQDRT